MSIRRSFTLHELILIIAAFFLFTAMLYSVQVRTQSQMGLIRCKANLARLGAAFGQYGEDHGGYYPTSVSAQSRRRNVMYWDKGFDRWDSSLRNSWWHSQLYSYLPDRKAYYCPAVPVKDTKGKTLKNPVVNGSNYAFNGRLSMLPGESGRKIDETEWPDVTPLVSERDSVTQTRIYLSPLDRRYNAGYSTLNTAHGGGQKRFGYVLMADYSVKAVPKHKWITDEVKDSYEQERD